MTYRCSVLFYQDCMKENAQAPEMLNVCWCSHSSHEGCFVSRNAIVVQLYCICLFFFLFVFWYEWIRNPLRCSSQPQKSVLFVVLRVRPTLPPEALTVFKNPSKKKNLKKQVVASDNCHPASEINNKSFWIACCINVNADFLQLTLSECFRWVHLNWLKVSHYTPTVICLINVITQVSASFVIFQHGCREKLLLLQWLC